MRATRRRATSIILALTSVLALPGAVRAGDSDTPDDMAAMTANIGRTPFAVQGFGNVDLLASSPDGLHTGFQTGALDLFITSRLDDHWSALGELVFEPSANEIVTDLERFEFLYEYSDAFRVSVGRVHNPFLRWPITNHHGLFMATPVDRPIIARWEDEPGLWPMHFVGVLAQGRLQGPAGLNYALGVGNGRGHVLDEVQVGQDANNDKAVIASLGASPEALPGLEVHAALYADQVPADTTLRERDFSCSAAYAHGDVELRGEWSRIDHRNDDVKLHYQTSGWYVLGSYRIAVAGTHVKPYLLVEELQAAHDDFFLGLPADERAWTCGARWDATRFVAIKGEFHSSSAGGGPRANAVRAQLAVHF